MVTSRKLRALFRVSRPVISQQRQKIAVPPCDGVPSAVAPVQTRYQTARNGARPPASKSAARVADKKRPIFAFKVSVVSFVCLSPPNAMDGKLIRAVPLRRKKTVGERKIEKGKA